MNDQTPVFRTSQLEENDGPGHNPTDNCHTMGELIALADSPAVAF